LSRLPLEVRLRQPHFVCHSRRSAVP